MSISKTEHDIGYPGCRSVIAFGDNIEYLADEIRLDDYILNYSKQPVADLSEMAKKQVILSLFITLRNCK